MSIFCFSFVRGPQVAGNWCSLHFVDVQQSMALKWIIFYRILPKLPLVDGEDDHSQNTSGSLSEEEKS